MHPDLYRHPLVHIFMDLKWKKLHWIKLMSILIQVQYIAICDSSFSRWYVCIFKDLNWTPTMSFRLGCFCRTRVSLCPSCSTTALICLNLIRPIWPETLLTSPKLTYRTPQAPSKMCIMRHLTYIVKSSFSAVDLRCTMPYAEWLWWWLKCESVQVGSACGCPRWATTPTLWVLPVDCSLFLSVSVRRYMKSFQQRGFAKRDRYINDKIEMRAKPCCKQSIFNRIYCRWH